MSIKDKGKDREPLKWSSFVDGSNVHFDAVGESGVRYSVKPGAVQGFYNSRFVLSVDGRSQIIRFTSSMAAKDHAQKLEWK